MESSAKRSILICDDSMVEIRVLVSMLKGDDYIISFATNGRDACMRAGVLKPDLILLDIRMPGMDGLATCRILKAHKDTCDIPVIFLTAANELADRITGLRCGAVDYIVKPASEEEVLLRIAAHIKRPDTDSHFTLGHYPREVSALVRACVKLLESDLSQSPSAEELQQRLGTSRHGISSAFRTVFGTSVYAWLRERRMQQACHWLTHTNMRISNIAESLGYNNSGNFTTAFRERFSMPPRIYRAEMQRKLVQSISSNEIESGNS